MANRLFNEKLYYIGICSVHRRSTLPAGRSPESNRQLGKSPYMLYRKSIWEEKYEVLEKLKIPED